MKFTVSSSVLLPALQSLSKVIASKNTLPVLDSFLFNLEEKRLVITASDVETKLVTTVELTESEGLGVFCIDAKRLLDPLKELPDQPLYFEINDDNMSVVVKYANDGTFLLPGQSGDAYPQSKPLKEDAQKSSIESQVLLNGVSRTAFAAADDDLRPVMNGIYFDLQPEHITFVATDGHKLVRLRNTTVQTPERAAFILPQKPAKLLKELLKKNDDAVTFQFDDNNAYFVAPNFEMICRLIEGRFPNYDSVIPKDNPNIVTVERQPFINTLKRVSVFSNQASNLVKLQISENEIIISAQDIDFATSGEEKIKCDYTATPLNIGFKAGFLIDILSNFTSSEVKLQLADPSRAGVLIPAENEANEEQLMLLMPMMLND
ncbi:MAG: DNA polymerase III subunit beta [Tannerella sp.]|jgi:DNA polymerase-3 subunit beta|nr:DNA polymerase III subunit beta [Tannerella sp.]